MTKKQKIEETGSIMFLILIALIGMEIIFLIGLFVWTNPTTIFLTLAWLVPTGYWFLMFLLWIEDAKKELKGLR